MRSNAEGRSQERRTARRALAAAVIITAGGLLAAATRGDDAARVPLADALLQEQVLRGRALVISHDCGACHGGSVNPASEAWLTGGSEPEIIGPFEVWARNLTPDDETGIGRYTERQIFNAIRYGLRPSATPDVEITSHVPGVGNHPQNPNYLAPGMPWLWFRHMDDQELRDIAAYLKRGLRPVHNVVPDPQGPPDHWAEAYPADAIGGALPPFPMEREELRDAARRDEVLRGRTLVAQLACSACHGGAIVPAQENWMTGAMGQNPFADEFEIGPFKTYPRNLTPDNATGIGRFTERQLFNALRWGLRPGETPDVDITSAVPGQGNHPVRPKYLAVPMPWIAYRHLPDADIRAIAAYLKNGLRPVSNRVQDSDGPPDFWAEEYADPKYGTYPAPPFPTARERSPTP